jgi:hypothetical protein
MVVVAKSNQRRKIDKDDPEAIASRNRVLSIIDAVPPEDLIASIKRAPSLRGMILGYIAEEMFEKYVPKQYPSIEAKHIVKHDDHDRSANKSDRTIFFANRIYRIQLKSIQTNSIARNLESGLLVADVQNDASDRRTVKLPNGSKIETTCYARGDYDILAVPMFPFTGSWTFAYKRNIDCRSSESDKYSQDDRNYLLATTEKVSWPLSLGWHSNLLELLDGKIGLVP